MPTLRSARAARPAESVRASFPLGRHRRGFSVPVPHVQSRVPGVASWKWPPERTPRAISAGSGDRIRTCDLGVMSYALAVFGCSRDLKSAVQRGSGVQPVAPCRIDLRRFRSVLFPNLFPIPGVELRESQDLHSQSASVDAGALRPWRPAFLVTAKCLQQSVALRQVERCTVPANADWKPVPAFMPPPVRVRNSLAEVTASTHLGISMKLLCASLDCLITSVTSAGWQTSDAVISHPNKQPGKIVKHDQR